MSAFESILPKPLSDLFMAGRCVIASVRSNFHQRRPAAANINVAITITDGNGIHTKVRRKER